MPCRYGHCPLGSRVSCGTHGTRVLHGAWELLSGGTCGAGACFRGRPTEVAKPKLPVESELNHRGDGRGAEQRPFRRKRVSGLPRAVPPPPTRPCSGGSAAAMEPAGLEQILRELLLPDTERIRRVRDGGWGGGLDRDEREEVVGKP